MLASDDYHYRLMTHLPLQMIRRPNLLEVMIILLMSPWKKDRYVIQMYHVMTDKVGKCAITMEQQFFLVTFKSYSILVLDGLLENVVFKCLLQC